jgi:hypothetical protein
VLAGKLCLLGPSFEPGLLEYCRDLRIGHEVPVALLIPVENHPYLMVSFGSRKTCEPLDACCFRFSAPLVVNALQKRSKSSTFTVDRIIVFLRWSRRFDWYSPEQGADPRYPKVCCLAGRSSAIRLSLARASPSGARFRGTAEARSLSGRSSRGLLPQPDGFERLLGGSEDPSAR